MSTRWNKILRDLFQNRTQSLLAVLAIALGLFGFGSLLSTYSILTREINSGYLSTNPASATFWVDRIDGPLLDTVRRVPGVGEVEQRRTIGGRMRIAPNEWRNMQIFVIHDFNNIQVSTLRPQKGKWPPQRGEVLIERDAMSVARARIGDTVTLQSTNGPELKLRVVGTVHDAGKAQARMEQLVYAYITLETLRLLGEQPYFDELKIVIAEKKFDERHVVQMISNVRKQMESSGFDVRRVDIPSPGKHPHADLMGTLLLFKSSFGLLALVLSGVLVINLLSALMAGQKRQVGIMKAIGGRRRQIMELYLAGVLVLSLASLIIAIPLSIWGAYALSDFMARFLNFDLSSYSIPAWVFALQIAAGLIVPILAALYPVYRGTGIAVREAIADYGVPQNKFGQTVFDQVLSRAGGSARPLLLSLRNTFRRRARFILILATLVAGGSIFVAAWNVRASLIRTVDVMLNTLRYDMTLTFAEFYPIDKLEAVLRNTAHVAYVESWAGAEASVINPDGSKGEQFYIAGPPESTRTLRLNIVEGRNLQPDDDYTLVINDALLRRLPELRVGKTVSLQIGDRKNSWRIIGVARQPFGARAAYANRSVLAELAGRTGVTNSVRVVATKHDKDTIDEIKRMLEQNLANAGFRATNNTSLADRRHVIDEHNSVIYTSLIVMALLIVLVGGLGLATVMSINVLERRREIGILRAIGATRRKVLFIIIGEGALIGLMSWILAVGVSMLISKQLGSIAAGRILHTKLEFAVDHAGILIWLLVVLFFGAAASFLPAWRASRLPVREVLQYE